MKQIYHTNGAAFPADTPCPYYRGLRNSIFYRSRFLFEFG